MSKNMVYSNRLLIFIILIVVAVSGVYYPGLFGDYVFDDSANILENSKLAISSLSVQGLTRAALSGEAGPLGRPISMLSFALNYYTTGFDPFYFKLTNLFVHIINTCLVLIIARTVFQQLNPENIKLHNSGALCVALVWGLHPLNLTSVLYVVQRMTSLSALFGLLAVVLYGYLRTRQHIRPWRTFFWVFSIGVCLLASVFSKESGLLFAPLLLLIELVIFQGKNQQKQDIRWFNIKLIHWLLAVAFLIGVFIATKIPSYLSPASFLNRDFTLQERLLSETRVLFLYLKLFFYPRLTELSLYHDDFTLSHSLFEPISTLLAVGGLIIISLASLASYKKAPLILFAWTWFLIGHSLESTFFSLELIHEHRNYFATIGFSLLFPYAILQAPPKTKPWMVGLLFFFIVYLSLTTWQRATVWSNLVDHAAFEAETHPNSDRANYQLARIYMKLMDKEEDEEAKALFSNKSAYYLQKARNSYLASNGGWFAQLHLSYYLGGEPSEKIVNELLQRLNKQPFHNSNIGYLGAFTSCQIDRHCHMPHHIAVKIIAAGLDNPNTSRKSKAEIYKLLARYFAEVAGDFVKAEEFFKDALSTREDVNGHLLLNQVYRLWNKLELAQKQLEKARILDTKKVWYTEIEYEQGLLDAKKNQQNRVKTLYEN